MHGGGGSEESLMRLRVLEETDDGFKIAEADLKLRGPGEVTGLRQWGGAGFRIANPLRDRELLGQARDWAAALLEPGFPWGYGEQERFVRWVEGWQQRWGAYGRIG
jgi:ATP-dependent DNA helicase RecG